MGLQHVTDGALVDFARCHLVVEIDGTGEVFGRHYLVAVGFRWLHIQIFHDFLELFFALFAEGATVFLDAALQSRFGRGRSQKLKPFLLRVLGFGGDDFHLVAVAQHLVELGKLAVNVGGNAVVADFRVDIVGEIEHSGTFGQQNHLALRGKHVNFVGEKVKFEIVDKFDGIFGLVVDEVLCLFQPNVEAAFGLVVRLVFPIGREAFFGDFFHALAADLHFDPIASLTHHHGVQTFVAIGLGKRNPVF